MVATIRSSSGKESQAAVQVRFLGTKERRKHALKGLGLSWGLMLATAPLPPIHWVTVPFFFFFGFYLAAKRWQETSYFLPFSFSCPECGKGVDVKAQPAKENWEQVCPECRFGLHCAAKTVAGN